MNEPWRSRVPRWIDVALVVPLIAVVVIGMWRIDSESGDRPVDWLAYALGVTGVSSLAFWRRSAPWVTALAATVMFVYLARDYTGGPALLAGPLSLLALGYTVPRRMAWIGAAGLAVAATVGGALGKGLGLPGVIAFGWSFAAVLAGQALAARGERAAAERERATHAQEKAIANERLRIAQDLHDSVAHAMATINVQSGVAAHLIERHPEQAAAALEAIRTASRDALEELGAILGVLRESGSDVPLNPVSGIADIPALVERATADGLAITLTTSGDAASVPPSIGTAAYRVVQEALTNTRRHAAQGAAVTITIDADDNHALRIAVADNGGRSAPAMRSTNGAGGFGLVGMRERVESSGGTLDAGPDARGFHVVATWKADRR